MAAYRERFQAMYQAWQSFNTRSFDGVLLEPHLLPWRTAPRSLAECSATTAYSGEGQMMVNANLLFGRNREWVINGRPAEGTRLFVEDLVLRLCIQQFLIEEKGDEEREGGYGPSFVEHASRIGGKLGVGEVVARRRKTGPQELACGWPHCVRPEGYYKGDVSEAALLMAAVIPSAHETVSGEPESAIQIVWRHTASDDVPWTRPVRCPAMIWKRTTCRHGPGSMRGRDNSPAGR